jgi:hypothetical protein
MVESDGSEHASRFLGAESQPLQLKDRGEGLTHGA